MFVDGVVLAGIAAVGLMLLFCAGFAYFIRKGARRKRPR